MGDAIYKPGNPMTLIIDGASLKFALLPELKLDFLRLCTSCKSVICCRVSPMQKAEVSSFCHLCRKKDLYLLF